MQVHAAPAVRQVHSQRVLDDAAHAVGERRRRACERRLQRGGLQRDLARGVERDEVEPHAGVEDPRERLGIDVRVELGVGRYVARHVYRAAHRHHAAGAADRRRVALDGERQVGQRTQGDDREAAAVPRRRVGDHPWGVDGSDSRLDGGPVRQVAESVAAVVRGDAERPGQRPCRAGRHERRGQRPAQVEQPEDVADAGLERGVAGHDRDHVHRPLRRAPGQQQRQRVVDAGVGVDEGPAPRIGGHGVGILYNVSQPVGKGGDWMDIEILYCGE